MESRYIEVFRQPNREDEALSGDLLQALQRMVRRGHLPSSTLLVRLTDGRVRLHYSLQNRGEASDCLRRIRNEYGPVGTALWVSVAQEGTNVQLAIEELTPEPGGRMPPIRSAETRLEAMPCLPGQVSHSDALPNGRCQTFAGDGSTGRTSDFSASSKNFAMREASLGINTGWLPNVDSMLLPSGARSWLV